MAPVVDVHTHIYPPQYIELLKSRNTVPYIRSFPPDPTSRLVILPGEDSPDTPSTSHGRPIGPEYSDITKKIEFMDMHGINISVISLANPWLDFLPAETALQTAREINDDVERLCGLYPGRLYAFGALPLSASVPEIVEEVKRLAGLKYHRGVIMGTSGLGKGLDDERLGEVWKALEVTGQTVFLHPHYGLPKEVYGPNGGDYGHVLPLAMGFPMETTIAVSRMILSGVWDKYTNLTVLLAHSGGTLPFLAGRLESCIQHDAHLMAQSKDADAPARRTVWDILAKNILLDAVVYSEAGLLAAAKVAGADRVLFGTDNPFFPPLGKAEEGKMWTSVCSNIVAIDQTFDEEVFEGVMGVNAVRLLRLGE